MLPVRHFVQPLSKVMSLGITLNVIDVNMIRKRYSKHKKDSVFIIMKAIQYEYSLKY